MKISSFFKNLYFFIWYPGFSLIFDLYRDYGDRFVFLGNLLSFYTSLAFSEWF